MQLQVQGDEVSGYRMFIKIPETWRDAESRTTRARRSRRHLAAAIGIAVVLIAVLVIFLRSLKSPEIARVPWRQLGKWSLWMLLAAIVIYVNRMPQLLMNYTTTMPLATVLRHSFDFADFHCVALSGGRGSVAGLSWFFLERAFGPGRIPQWRRAARRVLSRRVLRGAFSALRR